MKIDFKKIIIVNFVGTLFFIYFINSVSAAHSNEFIEYVSLKIYEDCNGSALEFNNEPLRNEKTNEFIRLIPSYNRVRVREIIGVLDSTTWNFDLGNLKLRSGWNGKEILKCGDHWLDINGNDWYWDGISIDLPKIELQDNAKATFGNESPIVETYGDNSTVIIGNENKTKISDNNLIEQNNIWINLSLRNFNIVVILLGLILTVVYLINFLINRYLLVKYRHW